MSDINGMMDRLNGLPGRGTEHESRIVARHLESAGRRLGASEYEIRDVLEACGLLDAPDERRHVDVMKPSFNPNQKHSLWRPR